jgi:hypothetical protein
MSAQPIKPSPPPDGDLAIRFEQIEASIAEMQRAFEQLQTCFEQMQLRIEPLSSRLDAVELYLQGGPRPWPLDYEP